MRWAHRHLKQRKNRFLFESDDRKRVHGAEIAVLRLEIATYDILIDFWRPSLFSKEVTQIRDLGENLPTLRGNCDSDGCRSTQLGCFEPPTTLEN